MAKRPQKTVSHTYSFTVSTTAHATPPGTSPAPPHKRLISVLWALLLAVAAAGIIAGVQAFAH